MFYNKMNPIIFILILFMLIDIPMVSYLYQTTYSTMFSRINNGSSINKIRLYLAGFAVYILMTLGLYVFVISHAENEQLLSTILKAALLGAIIFGTYDLTNVASIPAFGIKEALIDTTWGGILFATVTAIYMMF